MKNCKFAVLAATILLFLTACTEDSKDFSNDTDPMTEDTIDITEGTAEPFDYSTNDLTANIMLGEYKGLSVTQESAVLTDEEFENEIAILLDNYSYYEEYTDRAVEEGDTVRADFAGYRDGVAFDGGTATDQTITAASGTGYIEGFAEAFIGQLPGQEFSFDVTFPESYSNKELAGVEVTFVCTVHAILDEELIVPELTDAFVQENLGFNTAEEFRISYRTTVENQKEYYVESNMYSDLWMQIVDNAQVLAYPSAEVDRIYNEQCSVYEQYAASFGVDYDTFLTSYLNVTDEQLLSDSKAYVKEQLVMYQLVKELGVEMTDEEYKEGLAFFADSYGMTVEDLVSYYGEETVRTSILWQKLMEVIAADSVIVKE